MDNTDSQPVMGRMLRALLEAVVVFMFSRQKTAWTETYDQMGSKVTVTIALAFAQSTTPKETHSNERNVPAAARRVRAPGVRPSGARGPQHAEARRHPPVSPARSGTGVVQHPVGRPAPGSPPTQAFPGPVNPEFTQSAKPLDPQVAPLPDYDAEADPEDELLHGSQTHDPVARDGALQDE